MSQPDNPGNVEPKDGRQRTRTEKGLQHELDTLHQRHKNNVRRIKGDMNLFSQTLMERGIQDPDLHSINSRLYENLQEAQGIVNRIKELGKKG